MNRHLQLMPLLLACMAPVSACGSREATEEREHPSVVITQWNDSTELFLEYPHLLAGEATGNWAIHLSDMETFKPITEGTLTVAFRRAGRETKSFTLNAPARDGIYLLDPVIEESGTYEVRLSLDGPQARSVHTLPAVEVFPDVSALPDEEEEEGGAIAFLKEQQWKIPFAVRPAAEMDVARTVVVPGEIIARDGGLAEVSAPAAGIALAGPNRGAPSVGEPVQAGQELIVLSPIADEGGYARARGEMERLGREAARAERLYAAGAIPEKRLQESRHALEIARAELAALGGRVDGDFRLHVRAPISGVVAERSFVPGGRVDAGESLFLIVDPRTLWLRVRVPPDNAALARRVGATFRAEGIDRVFTASSLVSIGSVLDEQTRTVPAIFAVDNPDGVLKVGQFVQAVVQVGGSVRGVAVPNESILDDAGTPVAYVQVGGESFERRVLTLGVRDGTHAVVLDGIQRGDMVVIDGAYQVRLASMSGESFSGGHAH
ncbi:MAG TPA: efflux RND transporter periplasmic adaptor subunit [Gemmatimonadota bacterium]|nr:efflux RND transporter periplasmic adaptor subunit [Gemmatimonadota bacterium]